MKRTIKGLIVLLAICGFMSAYSQAEKKPAGEVTLLSYNIRNGRGMDEKTDYKRTADVISKQKPDIVAVQEVDNKTTRSQKTDVLAELAQHTGMMGTYAKAIDYQGGEYGLGILSREKPLKVERISLPGREEKRVLLTAEFKAYVIMATHFSLTREDRLASLEIAAKEAKKYKKPVFLMGDLNFSPKDEEMSVLEKNFTVLNDKEQKTFPAPRPRGCIDFIAVYKTDKNPVKVTSREVVDEPKASDHRPVKVVVKLK